MTLRRTLTYEQEKEMRRHFFKLNWTTKQCMEKWGVSENMVNRTTCGGRMDKKGGRTPIEVAYGS